MQRNVGLTWAVLTLRATESLALRMERVRRQVLELHQLMAASVTCNRLHTA